MIDDEKIIEMFFERSEQAVRELDNKYGKICHHLSFNTPSPIIPLHRENRSEYFSQALLEERSSQTERTLYGRSGGN